MQRSDLLKFRCPDKPGIYTFKKGRTILYIGKATSLRDRVRSYFAGDLADTRGERIIDMVAKADRLSFEATNSVLEALILEAELIKKHQPPYNVDEKDNKSFNYVVVTKESFPRVLIVRGRELYLKWNASDIARTFGPYPHGKQLQDAMKLVRKIFPFRDSKCVPCGEQSRKRGDTSQARSHLGCKPCFNRQIGLCPGVCTGEMTKEEYAVRVRHLCQFLSGNFKGLKRALAREMKVAAATERFEDAARLKSQIYAMEHVRDVSLIAGERASSGGGVRIEAFDVAHTSGSETVAVMTVVSNGEKSPSEYRKFKIRSATNDDTAALREALERRLNHTEWRLPRIFVVDGGVGQLHAAQKVLKKAGIEIPLVGVVKNEFHKPERLIGDTGAIRVHERDILLANSEAHRFGIIFHRKRLHKRMFAA